MKKRVLSVLLIVALFVSCLAFSASAEGTPTLRLSNVSAGRGDEVIVDVIIENNPGVSMLELPIVYDTSRLKYVGYEAGIFTDWTLGTKAVFVSDANDTRNGTILKLKFEVLSEAPYGKTTVTFSASEMIAACINEGGDEEEVSFSVVDGSITIACAHEWDEGVVTKEPTCAEEGVKTFTCSKCNETRTESMKKAEHSSDGGKVTKQPTCTEKGVKTYTCKVCGEVLKTEEVPAKGHQSDGGKVTTEPTCTEKGVKTYTCTVCGEVLKTEEIPALGHTWNEGEITAEATCTEDGSMHFICTVCQTEKDEVIEAPGHDWDEGKVVKEATETQDGLKEFTCKVCEETKQESYKYSVATGDEAMPVLFTLLLVASAGAVVVLTRKLRKERG